MTLKILTISILTCCAFAALFLNGTRRSFVTISPGRPVRDPGALALFENGRSLFALARYRDARDMFTMASRQGDAAGDSRASATNRNNAGAAELMFMQYGEALKQFTEARRIASASHERLVFLRSMSNLANLYILTGQAENALRVATEALDAPKGNYDADLRAKLLSIMSIALAYLHRFDEALPVQEEAIRLLTELNQLDDLARLLAGMATYYVPAGRLDAAARVLDRGMQLVQTGKVTAAAAILMGQANLESKRQHPEVAEKLFQAALDVREDRTPRWKILADRGQFRLETNQDDLALVDFREAGHLVAQIRADMVPADQDRVAFETGIGQFLRGFVEAGNRISLRKGQPTTVTETFDAAEQSRLWSLRALLPDTGDWRSRLPPSYWEKLSIYQARQRRSLATANQTPDPATESLKLDLQQAEAAAGNQVPSRGSAAGSSALGHAQALLDGDTTLFSFSVAQESSWLWVVTQSSARVFRLPPEQELRATAQKFSRDLDAATGRKLYMQLFGLVPSGFLRHSRWLLEPDGPLHDVPFAALVADEKDGVPVYLIERAALQLIPGALLLQKRPFRTNGAFIGVGDPVYNAADSRYRGDKRKPEFSLPRLPGTARELRLSSGKWDPQNVHLLTGMEASAERFWRLAEANPSIVHFATHVVAGMGDYRSGLIALRLSPQGAMELLGPREVQARTVSADLVVMNGCHSAVGEAVPSSGRMGLTRAWIGAGAGAVMATQWDISDDDAELLMGGFYEALVRAPQKGVAEALRQAQLAALRTSRAGLKRWAGYYLLSRSL